MIKSLKIENYRGIRSLSVKNLKRINVFIGKNNSGKSSLLESLYLASSAFDIKNVLSRRTSNRIDYLINRRCHRDLNWISAKEVLWHNYNTEHPITVELELNSKNLSISLFDWHEHPLIGIKSIEGFDYFCFIEKLFVESKKRSLSVGSLFNESQKLGQFEPFMANFKFVDSFLMHEIDVIEKRLWKDLLKNRLDKLVVQVLREGYEIDIDDLTYTTYDEGKTYQLAVKLPQTTIRVDDLGDGARYSLLLIMITALSKNTVLLLEEPENHQHPVGLAKTLEMFLSLVKQNNIQVFITTHSLEFIKLLKQCAEDMKIDFNVFFIERDKQGIVEARELSGENLDVLERMGFDPRFLDMI